MILLYTIGMVAPLIAGGVRAAGAAAGARTAQNARKVQGVSSGAQRASGVQNPEVFRRTIRTGQRRFIESQSVGGRVARRREIADVSDEEEGRAAETTREMEEGRSSQTAFIQRRTSPERVPRKAKKTGHSLPLRTLTAGRNLALFWTMLPLTLWCLFLWLLFLLIGILLIAAGNQGYFWDTVTLDTFLPLSATGMFLIFLGIIPLIGAGVGGFFLIKSVRGVRKA